MLLILLILCWSYAPSCVSQVVLLHRQLASPTDWHLRFLPFLKLQSNALTMTWTRHLLRFIHADLTFIYQQGCFFYLVLQFYDSSLGFVTFKILIGIFEVFNSRPYFSSLSLCYWYVWVLSICPSSVGVLDGTRQLVSILWEGSSFLLLGSYVP